MGGEDVRNAAERLRKLLRSAQYPQLSTLRLEAGDVSDLLRVLHFVLLESSHAVAKFLVEKGYDLYGKTDARFVESAFRLLRDEFRCFPSLSATQFLSKQFVARRLTIVADAAAAVAHKRQELERLKRREDAVWSQPQDGGRRREMRAQVENHVLPTTVTNHAASILQHLKMQQTEAQSSGEKVASPALNSTGRRVDGRAPQVAVQFADESTSVSGEQEVVDDSVQTDNRPPSNGDSEKLVKVIGDLSRQLSEMSGALMSKISSVETRLGRLEGQMHDVQVAVEEQRDLFRKSNSAYINKTTDTADDVLPRTVNTTDTHQKLAAEPPCAWPPQPSVFERY